MVQPAHIGPYRVLRPLGDGGVGTVYLCQQDDPVRRKVAVKLIKLGMDTREVLARFTQERQMLALMNHPNIAKVFDAGVTDTGRPYFVMEYVEGVPLTDHCDAERLTIRQRLQLFATVCRAIQHAHQRGILHRDIKPSNVLVKRQDGVDTVVVIDFGLAKVIREDASAALLTRQGQILGTPRYMSPEQMELLPEEIDTRSDVYSLGVLFFELVVGVPPHDRRISEGGIPKLVMDMRNEETPRPSSRISQLAAASDVASKRNTDHQRLISEVRGDLDWIGLKAMERDRDRRYSTVAEFLADVERTLAHRPILARPPSVAYRAERFLRRHRGPVLAAAVACAALILGSGLSTSLYVRASSIIDERDALVTLCETTRNDVANAHLSFEEAVAGDETRDVEGDVYSVLQRSLDQLRLALEKGETPFGSIRAAQSEQTSERLSTLASGLDLFLNLARERWLDREGLGKIGGDLDQRFDEVYQVVEAQLGELANATQDEATSDWRRSAQAGIVVNLLALLAMLGGGGMALRLLQKGN